MDSGAAGAFQRMLGARRVPDAFRTVRRPGLTARCSCRSATEHRTYSAHLVLHTTWKEDLGPEKVTQKGHTQSTVGEDARTSIFEEAFANTSLAVPPGPALLWGPGDVPGEWADVCGFIKPPGSEKEWQIRMHGAFTIPYDKRTDQSCHHEVWIHLLHVNARLVDRVSRDDKSRRPNSRKRKSPYDHRKERQHWMRCEMTSGKCLLIQCNSWLNSGYTFLVLRASGLGS